MLPHAPLSPWLRPERHAALSTDCCALTLDSLSYSAWQQSTTAQNAAPHKAALCALLRELWHELLSADEQAILRAVLLHGHSDSQVALQMGKHHSSIGRARHRALQKLRDALQPALRYQELCHKLDGADEV